MFVRGHRSEYDHWAALGNDGWSYRDVLPHFRSIENSEVAGSEVEFASEAGPDKRDYVPVGQR